MIIFTLSYRVKRYFCQIATMNNRSKGNLKYIVAIALVVMLCSITLFSASNYSPGVNFYTPLTAPAAADTSPKKLRAKNKAALARKDTVGIKDTTGGRMQKVDSFDVKVSKDSLDAPVSYAATDSMVMEVPEKKIWLYNEAKVDYKDIKLTAGIINLDQANQKIRGYYFLDTAKKRDRASKIYAGGKQYAGRQALPITLSH